MLQNEKNSLYLRKREPLIMRMYTQAFNKMSELNDYVNAQGIDKDQIISIIQSKDGTFFLSYYAE